MFYAYEILIVLLMLIFNALCAGYEIALASISHARLLVLVEQKRAGATAALFMKERMEGTLAVCQMGMTFAGSVAAATGGATVDGHLSPYLESAWNLSGVTANILSLIFLIVPLSSLIIVAAELIPKTFALENKEWVCLTFSPLMRGLTGLASPIVRLFEGTVKAFMGYSRKRWRTNRSPEEATALHELSAAASLARASRLIGTREEKIVLAAAQLSFRPVREIALPAAEISMIPMGCPLPDAMIRAHLDLHTRFPVCSEEGNPQTIQGYVNFKDIVMTLKMSHGAGELRQIVRPIKRLSDALPIAQVLEQMMHEKVHIALVETADLKIFGMITLEDIIEELVGDIEDEFDRMPSHVHQTESGWIVGGALRMDAVGALLHVPFTYPLEGGKPPTLARWVDTELNRPPEKGEIFSREGVRFMVRKLRRRQVAEAFVSFVKAS